MVAEEGLRATTVEAVCRRAGMSKRTFYDVFADREACFAAAVRLGFDELYAAVDTAAAPVPGEPWEARAARIVTALVATFAGDQSIPRLCLVETAAAGPATRAIRRDAIGDLARILADGAAPGDDAQRLRAARGAIGAVLELAEARVGELPGDRADDTVAAAVYLALAPFSGRRAAAHWAQRADRAAPPAGTSATPRVTDLTRRTVLHLQAHPGARNVDVARAVGVGHESQISRHLARLERDGTVERRREGRSNAWRLTAPGHALARQVR